MLIDQGDIIIYEPRELVEGWLKLRGTMNGSIVDSQSVTINAVELIDDFLVINATLHKRTDS